MTASTHDDGPYRTPIGIGTVFAELDYYLHERVAEFRYDRDEGLAQLKHTIAASSPGTPNGAAHDSGRPAPVPASAPRPYADEAREWIDAHRGPAAAYLDALTVSPLRITSRNTHTFAARISGGIDGERWLLSWLPELTLTRKQVFSGMVLDEILIAHDHDSATMLDLMHDLAADLYLPLIHILQRLAIVKYPPPPPAWLLRAWSDEAPTAPSSSGGARDSFGRRAIAMYAPSRCNGNAAGELRRPI
ncbi:hypothetical protein BJY24_005698 [Nocardia transvalensis]|uniref:Uncharacterized protein n=1 Tax=Nocardia transvalensis TaxID=37333 RepID=A0A7W9UKS2_9NOCA|nr:hypothetical protein [Nocardia transvalensis]MBB5916786.1 hypothetical protein [Nocardia transvalensis]